MSIDEKPIEDVAREVLALADGATPGPWKEHMGEFGDPVIHGITTLDGTDVIGIDHSNCYYAGDTPVLACREADAAFIAYTRGAAVALARAVLDLTAERDALRVRVEQMVAREAVGSGNLLERVQEAREKFGEEWSALINDPKATP